MKNLITSIGCVMLLLIFVFQFTANQITHNQISSIDKYVNSFKEVVKQEGCITSKNSDLLKEKISSAIGCGQDEIMVCGSDNRLGRGKLIWYEIKVPIKNLIPAAKFLGLSKEDTEGVYKIRNMTTSEYIDRSS
ncbi:MAG: hypothetical protein PHH48_03515 [Eubacteriales bacterium]|nr:hypothetical protein [Eubacteriales bacterium]